ncbi:MAG: hypothetical protein HUN05_19175 [Desulfobacter sp.]|nr:MAG: hypothetical protein HUN05_19175 [Desulfobacter sp.]
MENKKLAAAMAAVYMAIRTGEETAAATAVEPPAQAVSEPSHNAQAFLMNAWGMTGRQALMNANTMMQMRMFK